MLDVYKTNGAFSWCELMTTDPAAARNFYGKLFGWKFEDMPMPNFTYNVVKAGGEAMGGIMPIPPEQKGMPPMWGTYVTVADVDATAREAEKLGGKVLLPPTDIPTVGRFCVIQDPQGAVLSAITYKMG